MNAACEEAIAAKNAAEGTDTFEMKRKECAEVLAKEYQEHLKDLKKKISNLKKGSKEWWRLNRELLEKKTNCSSIPPLRNGNEWMEDSKGKQQNIRQNHY